MNPFAFFWGAQLSLLGLTVWSLLTPGAWGTGYVHQTWFFAALNVLTAIWVYANLFLARVFREARWIMAAITANLGIWLIGVGYWMVSLLYPHFPEIGFLLRYYPGRLMYLLTYGAAIFEIAAFLKVRSDELRRPFRLMGWNFAASIVIGLVWRLAVIERWPHVNYYSLILTVHLPALLIGVRLAYRCWKGNLARTAGWEREVDTLGS